jgi:hypothetical protein
MSEAFRQRWGAPAWRASEVVADALAWADTASDVSTEAAVNASMWQGWACDDD